MSYEMVTEDLPTVENESPRKRKQKQPKRGAHIGRHCNGFHQATFCRAARKNGCVLMARRDGAFKPDLSRHDHQKQVGVRYGAARQK